MSRIRTAWALGFGFLVLAGWAYGGEPPPFRETARIPLRGEWQAPAELVGDCDVAATTHTWISLTGIWSSTASWKTGQIPGAGGVNLDTALFDGTSNVSVIGETPGGNALFSIVTTPEYLGDIGSPSNPMIVQIQGSLNNGEKAIFRGRGNVYFEFVTGVYGDAVVDTDTLDRVVLLGGTMRHVFVKSGNVVFAGNIQEITTCTVLGALTRVSLPTTISGWTLGELYMLGGFFESYENDWDRIVMGGGRMVQHGTFKDACVIRMFGGQVDYRATADIATLNPELFLYGGTFDASKLKQDLVCTSLVKGPNATIIGNVLGQGEFSATGIEIDLDQDYP